MVINVGRVDVDQNVIMEAVHLFKQEQDFDAHLARIVAKRIRREIKVSKILKGHRNEIEDRIRNYLVDDLGYIHMRHNKKEVNKLRKKFEDISREAANDILHRALMTRIITRINPRIEVSIAARDIKTLLKTSFQRYSVIYIPEQDTQTKLRKIILKVHSNRLRKNKITKLARGVVLRISRDINRNLDLETLMLDYRRDLESRFGDEESLRRIVDDYHE